jgi:hypothetical protein
MGMDEKSECVREQRTTSNLAFVVLSLGPLPPLRLPSPFVSPHVYHGSNTMRSLLLLMCGDSVGCSQALHLIVHQTHR